MIKEKHQFSRLIPMTFIGLETDTKPMWYLLDIINLQMMIN